MSISQQFAKPEGDAGKSRLGLNAIRIAGGTQSREKINLKVVQDYAEAIEAGAKFPPVIVFYDGDLYWLADGFHRHEAHRRAKRSTIAVEIRQGTQRDAILYGVGANAEHGLRRTNDDKRRAVLTLLGDQEWSRWSDREIAKQCAVSHEFVRKMRPVTVNVDSEDRTYTTKHGTVAAMNTSAIGRADGAVPAQLSERSDNANDETGEIEQAANDAFRAAAAESLPQAIKDLEGRKAQALAERKAGKVPEYNGLTAEQRIAQLEEANRSLEIEVEALRAENKTYREMKVLFEQGGFENVIAAKDREIQTQSIRIESESRDKVEWMKSAKHWRAEALKLGWTRDITIDISSGEEVVDDVARG